jgi:peptide chain release factor subunit 3
MFLNGVVDARTIQKYKEEAKEKGRDSWWLAYVMDVSDEEKAKGKTVEVGRAQFDTPHKKYTIFDAPGHKNYVPNMIMGAALADVAGLVISARKGEFEAGFEKDGQTREHAQLAKSLGVQRLVVIVNKMDDCHWGQRRYQEIRDGLGPFLAATGYAEKDVTWVPIAGLAGHNIADPLPAAVCKWYKGPTLMQILDEVTLDPRQAQGPLRIPIIDKMKDPALVCHGKVENGTVRLGDKLAVMPHGVPAQVLQLTDGKGRPVEYATPGENVQIKINVADDEQIQRGYVLCQRESPMPVTEVFEAEIDVLDLVEFKPIITRGYQCMMHIHTYHDEVIIKDIVKSWDRADPAGTEKLRPQFVRSQTRMLARVTAARDPLSLEKFDVMQ